MNKLVAWWNKPSNRLGLAMLASSVLDAAISEMQKGAINWPTLLALFVGGLLSIVFKDNSVLKSDVEKLIEDGVNVALAKNVPSMIEAAVNSGEQHAENLSNTGK